MVEPIKIQIRLQDLLDVINAHSNPAVASAVLDGTYVNPLGTDDRYPRYHKNYWTKNADDPTSRDHHQLLFKSYDKWSDKVTFTKCNPGDSWSRTDTMSLEDWRATRDFDPWLGQI